MEIEADNERWATQKASRRWSEALLLLLSLLAIITTELAPFEPRVSTVRNEALGVPGDASDSLVDVS